MPRPRSVLHAEVPETTTYGLRSTVRNGPHNTLGRTVRVELSHVDAILLAGALLERFATVPARDVRTLLRILTAAAQKAVEEAPEAG
jgi:hypothetical protein